jgi:hypothetical protein
MILWGSASVQKVFRRVPAGAFCLEQRRHPTHQHFYQLLLHAARQLLRNQQQQQRVQCSI